MHGNDYERRKVIDLFPGLCYVPALAADAGLPSDSRANIGATFF